MKYHYIWDRKHKEREGSIPEPSLIARSLGGGGGLNYFPNLLNLPNPSNLHLRLGFS